jgi:hypothetical protein
MRRYQQLTPHRNPVCFAGVRYEIAKAVMLLAAASIFFALVHPLAADPIGVGKVERLADAVAPAPSLLPALAFQVIDLLLLSPVPQTPLLSPDFTELICVLNC